MKTGKTLAELAAEVTRQHEIKKDYIADTRSMAMDTEGKIHIDGDKPLEFGVNQIAHRQIGEHLKIPAPYYDRMLAEAPELLATNVNKWFQKYPSVRMARTLEDHMRAFMSNSYRPLDNYDLCEAALPVFSKLKVKVVSSEITERKLYIKVVDERISRDLKDGVVLGKGHDRFDTVCPALVLSNSEVGFGSLSVETSVWTGGCSNLMVIRERSHRKTHLGAKL